MIESEVLLKKCAEATWLGPTVVRGPARQPEASLRRSRHGDRDAYTRMDGIIPRLGGIHALA